MKIGSQICGPVEKHFGGDMPFDLREYRDLSGLTQQQLARATRVDRSVICLLEKKQLEVDDAIAARIRRVLLKAIGKRRVRIDAVLAATGDGNVAENAG
jgi:predicted transcriptional regulator